METPQEGSKGIDFDPYENDLLGRVNSMQSSLMDIEIKV